MVKQEVLVALDAARGRYISGQELAAQLGVSRTAVWKAVAALRRDGIPIKAVTNRGYTLAQSVDVLNAAAVAAQLDEATVKALQIEVVDRLPGTNAALRSRADAGAREGLVLIAQAQSAGRGRGGHSFYSPPGGLYMSILLRPEIGARQAVGLTAMAAVAAARAAERLCGVPITIKWVNDLWKNGKKGLRHPDRGRAGPGIRYAGLRRAGAGLQRRSPGGRLAGGPAGRGGDALRRLPCPGCAGRAGGGVPERLLAALPRRAAAAIWTNTAAARP